MPGKASRRLPESYLPTDADLVAWVQQRPGRCLRDLCALCWPTLPWAGPAEGDSASGRLRVLGGAERTVADYLADRLQALVVRCLLAFAPHRLDQPDWLASISYTVRIAPAPVPKADAGSARPLLLFGAVALGQEAGRSPGEPPPVLAWWDSLLLLSILINLYIAGRLLTRRRGEVRS